MLLALFLQDRVKTLTGLETQIDDLDGPEQSMEYVKTDRDVIQQRIADLR